MRSSLVSILVLALSQLAFAQGIPVYIGETVYVTNNTGESIDVFIDGDNVNHTWVDDVRMGMAFSMTIGQTSILELAFEQGGAREFTISAYGRLTFQFYGSAYFHYQYDDWEEITFNPSGAPELEYPSYPPPAGDDNDSGGGGCFISTIDNRP